MKKFQYQTGFWKSFNPRNCLVATIEKFRNFLDQGKKYTALLTDLSKAFDCLPLDRIAKLHAYNFDMLSLSFLKDRYQRVKVNKCYSHWSLNKYGVPQGSAYCIPFGWFNRFCKLCCWQYALCPCYKLLP